MHTFSSGYDLPAFRHAPRHPLLRPLRRPLALGFLAAAALLMAVWLLVLPIVLPLHLLRLRRAPAPGQRPVSATAVATLWGRAVAAACGFGTDPLAPPLLRAVGGVAGVPGSGLHLRLWTALVLAQWRTTGTLLTETLAALCRQPVSEVALLLARTALLDSMVRAFRARYPAGQLVVLGAGFDTRCWRFGGGLEVDAPATQAAKVAAVRAAGWGTEGVTFLAVDLVEDSWLDRAGELGSGRTCPPAWSSRVSRRTCRRTTWRTSSVTSPTAPPAPSSASTTSTPRWSGACSDGCAPSGRRCGSGSRRATWRRSSTAAASTFWNMRGLRAWRVASPPETSTGPHSCAWGRSGGWSSAASPTATLHPPPSPEHLSPPHERCLWICSFHLINGSPPLGTP